MPTIGQLERATQDRVVMLLANQLGWEYLGNWHDREDNSNIEKSYLRAYLQSRYSERLMDKAIRELRTVAGDKTRNLYEVNKEVYELLRYGVKVREEVGENKQTVWLIDWRNPENNHFGFAEEVSIRGENKKRPDIVLYVNGIALGVLELKRGTVSVSEGIRQNLDNQKSAFIEQFFHTMQLVFAGNDTEGLRYGAIKTPEKYYLKWKEADRTEYGRLLDWNLVRQYDALDLPLDKHLVQICNKGRFLEIIYDFTLFDGGIKKVCRPHQYFGVKAAQQRIRQREGGIIWHSQGSGKSLTMVWLTKWIRENVDNSRILIITDRDELDKQIVRVFADAGETMVRARSGADLVNKLNTNAHPLLCSLIHKFGRQEEGAYDDFIEEITRSLPPGFKAKGNVYVFVDECHRTQSGKLHDAMKAILPEALFIGFTGTPLLKADKKKSVEVFGTYIHTYKFDEAVADNVILDLQYEARDVDQKINDQRSIDEWFDAETQGLTDMAKAQLKQRWGTMRSVLSSKSRLEKIVFDILKDFKVKPRLSTGLGNAMLVSGSVYEACKYYELFQSTPLAGYCAIVTSYEPNIQKIKGEETGAGATEELMKYDIYKRMLNGKNTEVFEDEAKRQFIKEPARMKLLIVVDKLLTGFDAPSATYLYIDKNMQDHALFQAICRVNRLDSEDKEYGYIVDYKDLFRSLESAINDYTKEAFAKLDEADVKGIVKNRLVEARERLDEALEIVHTLCDPVHPKAQIDFIRYFCGNTENKDDLKDRERLRLALYTQTASLIRAYSNLANEMLKAGYTQAQSDSIHKQVVFYTNLRDEIKIASRDYIDLKAYEPGMRQLIDMYIAADPSRKISAFDDMTLVQLIVERGEAALDELPENIRRNPEAVAETIENNNRKVIIEESPTNPKYYERMSSLLDALIRERKQEAIAYAEYLRRIVELTGLIKSPEASRAYSNRLDTPAKRALYDNLGQDEDLAIELDEIIRSTKKDGWRGNVLKEREVKYAVKKLIPDNFDLNKIFDLIKNQDEY
jgi:type I restriction enzyme R subunit